MSAGCNEPFNHNRKIIGFDTFEGFPSVHKKDGSAAVATPGAYGVTPGSETFLDFLTWREPRRVAELARIVVVPRVGSAFDPESAAAQKVVREVGAEPLIVRVTSLPISASDLRRRVREGRSIAYRLPDAVAAHIRARGLYRDGGA